ncbi:MAG TPA: hypothetical protein IAC04_02915 [Candidatus Coprenecus stercoravium]|uniref:Lipoprotein n=1 Tax=Candidatus Coprenecus stercoravium TaxID=2840735 RepID=A0A9D2GNP2_9BACT|nr:hypothetical protein [Candidatus Coprenecus stercoravium]
MKNFIIIAILAAAFTACTTKIPGEKGCVILQRSDGTYDLKTPKGEKIKLQADSLKWFYDCFYRIYLPDSTQRAYVPKYNFLTDAYDKIYFGGQQFLVHTDDAVGVVQPWDQIPPSSATDSIYIFYVQHLEEYLYVVQHREYVWFLDKVVKYNSTWPLHTIFTADYWRSTTFSDEQLAEILKSAKRNEYEVGWIID